MRTTRSAPARVRALASACLIASFSLLLAAPSSAQIIRRDLSIDLAATPDPVPAGGQLAVTMTVANNGPAPALSVRVTSSTPSGTTLASASTTKGDFVMLPPEGGTGPIDCIVGAMLSGEVQTITLIVTVTAAPGSSITTTAMVDGLVTEIDPDTTNNRDSIAVMVAPAAKADMAVSIASETPTAGSGSLFTYTITVTNVPAPDSEPAPGVVLTIPTPDGSTFSAVTASQGTSTTPDIGASGSVVCSLGTVEVGASATAMLTVAVTDAAGATLTLRAGVTSGATDLAPDNNMASLDTPVVASGGALLSWEPPDAEGGAPRRLLVTESSERTGATRAPPAVTGYKVYRSNRPGVAPSPSNIFATLPPGQTSAPASVAPGGTFYVVTACYADGESPPSNEGSAGVPAAVVTKLKIKPSKITATGTGFTDDVTVTLDGIAFAAPSAVKKSNTKVVQKGALTTGETIGSYLDAHPTVLITFRNTTGGITSVRLEP